MPALKKSEDSQDRLAELLTGIAPLREAILRHPLYSALSSLPALRRFMEHHVFAVWDFMSLLKALQRDLSCVSLPWVPRGPRSSRRLILEIVLGEECDSIDGESISHFELYLRAMRELGADLAPVSAFVEQVAAGLDLETALRCAAVPSAAQNFVLSTWNLVQTGATHVLAGAFTFGREDLIPEMFLKILDDLSREHPTRLVSFRKYLERHIQLDAESHHPLALAMVQELCGEDAARWSQAEAGAATSLQARLQLWDAIAGG